MPTSAAVSLHPRPLSVTTVRVICCDMKLLLHYHFFSLFLREQILGEDQRPLVVRKGKKLKEDHPKREVPPDAPIIDVSLDIWVHFCQLNCVCLQQVFAANISKVMLSI